MAFIFTHRPPIRFRNQLSLSCNAALLVLDWVLIEMDRDIEDYILLLDFVQRIGLVCLWQAVGYILTTCSLGQLTSTVTRYPSGYNLSLVHL